MQAHLEDGILMANIETKEDTFVVEVRISFENLLVNICLKL